MANLRRNDKDYKYPESNALIGAKYGATLLENKILAIAFSELDRAHFAPDGTIVVSFKAAELRKLLGDENNNLYNSLKKVSEKMIGRVFGITNDENHEFHYAALVTNADYVNGVFTITFNSKLRNYLVNLKDRYTLLSLSEMLSFKSVYAFRIYEILRSHAFEKNHYAQRRTDGGYEISAGLSELKFQLGIINAQEPEVQRILQKTVPPDYDAAMEAAKVQKYKSYTQFRRGILDPAIAEINEKTGMNLSYNTLRSGLGGKVVSVEFVISGTDMKTLQTADAVLDASVIESSSAAEVSVTSKGFSSAASSTGTRKRSGRPKKHHDIELVSRVIDLIDEKISIADAESLLTAAGEDMSKIEYAYDLARKSRSKINNLVPWLISAIKNEYKAPSSAGKTASKGSSFNQIETHDYDWNDMERKLLNQ